MKRHKRQKILAPWPFLRLDGPAYGPGRRNNNTGGTAPPAPEAPTAAFSWQADANDPLRVCFTSASFGPDGGPPETLGHQWSFGGDTGTSTCHRFDECGTYPVTLAVTTASGATATATQSVTTTCAGGTNRPTATIAAEHRVVDCASTEWTFTPHDLTTDAEGTPWRSSRQLEFRWEMPNGDTHTGDTFVWSGNPDAYAHPTLTVTDTRFGTEATVQEAFGPEPWQPVPDVTAAVVAGFEPATIRITYRPKEAPYAEIQAFLTTGIPITDPDTRILRPPVAEWRAEAPETALVTPLQQDVRIEDIMAQHGIDEAPANWTVQLRYKSPRGTCGATFDDPANGVSRTTPTAATPPGRIVPHPAVVRRCVTSVTATAPTATGGRVVETALDGDAVEHVVEIPVTIDFGVDAATLADMGLSTRFSIRYQDGLGFPVTPLPITIPSEDSTNFTLKAYSSLHTASGRDTSGMIIARQLHEATSFDLRIEVFRSGLKCTETTLAGVEVPDTTVQVSDPPPCPSEFTVARWDDLGGPTMIQTIGPDGGLAFKLNVPYSINTGGLLDADLEAKNLTLAVSIEYTNQEGERVASYALQLPAGAEGGGATQGNTSVQVNSLGHDDRTDMVQAPGFHLGGPKPFRMSFQLYNADTLRTCELQHLDFDGYETFLEDQSGEPLPPPPSPCPQAFLVTKDTTTRDYNNEFTGIPTLIREISQEGFERASISVPVNISFGTTSLEEILAMGLRVWVEAQALGDQYSDLPPGTLESVAGGGWAQDGRTTVEIATAGFRDSPNHVRLDGLSKGIPWGLSVDDMPNAVLLTLPEDDTRARVVARPFRLTFRLLEKDTAPGPDGVYPTGPGLDCSLEQTLEYDGFFGFYDDQRPPGGLVPVTEEPSPPPTGCTPGATFVALRAFSPRGENSYYTLTSDPVTDTHWYEIPVTLDYGDRSAAELDEAGLELRASLEREDGSRVDETATKAGASWGAPDDDGIIKVKVASGNRENIPGDPTGILTWEGLHTSREPFRITLSLRSPGGQTCPDAESTLAYGPDDGFTEVVDRDITPPGGEDAGIDDDAVPAEPTFSVFVDDAAGTVTLTDTTTDASLSGHTKTEWWIPEGAVILEGALNAESITFQIPDDVVGSVVAVEIRKTDPVAQHTARAAAVVPVATIPPPTTDQDRGYPTADFILYQGVGDDGFRAFNTSWGPETDSQHDYLWSLPKHTFTGATSSTEFDVDDWKTRPGTHEVTLTVTDRETGKSSTKTSTVTVVEQPDPEAPPQTGLLRADFEYGTEGINTPTRVELVSTSTSSAGPIESHHWTVEGDDMSWKPGKDPETNQTILADQETYEFTAETPGFVRVTLTVASGGLTDTVSKRILIPEIHTPGPTAGFEWTKRPQTNAQTAEEDNRTIVFANTSKSNITTRATRKLIYYWSFGDGTFSTQRNPVHRYPAANTSYKVHLIVAAVPIGEAATGDLDASINEGIRNLDQIDKATHTVNTDDRVRNSEHVVDFEADEDYPNNEVYFVDKSTDDPRHTARSIYPWFTWSQLVKWEYDFGDGSIRDFPEAGVHDDWVIRQIGTPPPWQTTGFFHKYPAVTDIDRPWGPQKWEVIARVQNVFDEWKSVTKVVESQDTRPRPMADALVGHDETSYVIVPLDQTKPSEFNEDGGDAEIVYVKYQHPGSTIGPETVRDKPANRTLTIRYADPGPKTLTTTYRDSTGQEIRESKTIVIPPSS